MAKRILKKIILIVAVSPLLAMLVIAKVLADIFSELEDWTDSIFTGVGKWLAGKLGIIE